MEVKLGQEDLHHGFFFFFLSNYLRYDFALLDFGGLIGSLDPDACRTYSTYCGAQTTHSSPSEGLPPVLFFFFCQLNLTSLGGGHDSANARFDLLE